MLPFHRRTVRSRRGILTAALPRAFVLAALTNLGVGPAVAGADAARPPRLALLPIRLLDTSGEPQDQRVAHANRLTALEASLRRHLAESGRYGIVSVAAADLDAACPRDTPARQGSDCILAQATARGTDLAFVAVVHKSSSLIMQLFVRIVDVGTTETRVTRELSFRGDTDESWARAGAFLAAQIDAEATKDVR